MGYKDWLLDILIRCGIGEIKNTQFLYLDQAFELDHIIYTEDDKKRHMGYFLTPSAANYLKENE